MIFRVVISFFFLLNRNKKVEITVRGSINPKTGMLINISILKKFIQVIFF